MPSDDYASASGGALKLKGAKVKKHKKKKDKSGDLERALSTTAGGSGEATALSKREGDDARPGKSKRESDDRSGDEEDDSAPVMTKTEAQRKFEEARKKKLREIAETAHSRPELLKTHKDRVEELNVYLSKLSEHHDMPKIGPG